MAYSENRPPQEGVKIKVVERLITFDARTKNCSVRNVNMCVERKLYARVVVHSVTYEEETWAMLEGERHKLCVMDTKFLQSMQSITSMARPTTEEMRHRVGKELVWQKR